MMLQQLWPNQKIDFTEKKEKENTEKREEYWEELIEINDMPSSSGAVLEIMNH